MNNITITAVIPAFNAQDTLLRAAHSILNQSFDDVELIIVDDGSTDDTLALARSINDVRVKVIAQENQGPGAARNAGLSQAKGQWVAFLDSDDTWEPDFFDHALFSLSLHPSILFYFGSSQLIKDGNSKPRKAVDQTPYIFTANKKATEKKLRSEVELSLCYMLADRKTIMALGGYYDKNKCTYGEDSVLSFLIFWQYPVLKTNKVIHHYHRAQTGLSASRHSNVQVKPVVSDSEYLLSRLPTGSHAKVRGFVAYNASVDAYRLAKVGKVADGFKLIKDNRVLRNAYRPGTFRSLCRFVFHSVTGVFKRNKKHT